MRIMIESTELEEIHIDFLERVLTKDWIKEQLKIVDEVSQFKEQGSILGLFHPLVADYLSLRVSIRKASILDQDTILMGIGHNNIVELGRNLYELQGLYNVDKIRARIQSKDLFEDVCWELEVAMALKYGGFDINFVDETDKPTYDILGKFNGRQVAIECKRKHIKDKDYNFNRIFSTYLGKRLIEELEKHDGKHEVLITVNGVGKLEDAKLILHTFRDMLNSNTPIKYVKDSCRITLTDKFRGTDTGLIMRGNKAEFALASSKKNNLKEVYTDNHSETEFKDRVFFKFDSQNLQIKNLRSLLSTANKQLNGNLSCLFLKVPYFAHDLAVQEVEDLLSKRYENIGAVKIVSTQKTFSEDYGVKTGRKEVLRINSNAAIKVSEKIVDLLSNTTMFSKYVSM